MRFRKKPVEIEAEQYRLGLEDGFMTIGEAITRGLVSEGYAHPKCAHFKGIPYLQTLEGAYQFISEGDWIITGVEGERYPCKHEIFLKTYEAVDGDMICPECKRMYDSHAGTEVLLGDLAFCSHACCDEWMNKAEG
jgi:uncharacterized protein YbaR (Trm112 family)